MPIKPMTQEDKERIFGSGLIIFRQLKPLPVKDVEQGAKDDKGSIEPTLPSPKEGDYGLD